MVETQLEVNETRQPFDLSDRLQAKVDALDLQESVDFVQQHGFSFLTHAAPSEFNERLRDTLLRMNAENHTNMLLDKDPIFTEVVLNPAILAIVEVLCGKGAMLSQLACSVRKEGAPALGLHADQNWTPAPFPVHNQLVTFCWACDEFTQAGGATKIIPDSHLLRRHPSLSEIKAEQGAISMDCAAGTIPFWDGAVWHGNYPRKIAGTRVVLHITYSRLALRPVESYDYLDEHWLADKPHKMRVLLGREDFLNTTAGAFANPEALQRTMNWAKT